MSAVLASRSPGAWRADGHILTLGVLWLLLGVVACLALGQGAMALGPGQVLAALAAPLGLDLPWAVDPREAAVVVQIRLPRLLLGMAVGAALALAGAALQGLFRNPLADPGLIGVSSGAALGAVAVIVLGGALPLPLAAFGGGLAATLAAYRLASVGGRTAVATLLLAGIAINALAGAGTGLLTYLADDQQLRSLTFWSLGSLGGATWATLLGAGPWLLPALVLLPLLARPLNALLLGEAEAGYLGVDVHRLKRRVLLLSALAVGAAVAVSGVIGFVGLVVPHLLRLALGPDHRRVLSGSALLGAALLPGADLLARTLAAPAELPIGILTALTGGPFFLWLLIRRRREWH